MWKAQFSKSLFKVWLSLPKFHYIYKDNLKKNLNKTKYTQ